MKLKTNNPNKYRLIGSVFMLYCEEQGFENPQVYFEHDGFSCSAQDDDEIERNFRAVDAACPMCLNSGVEYCRNCGRSNQIDFEEC
jgi:hypothetical protein